MSIRRRGRAKPSVCTVYHPSGSTPDITGLANARLGNAGDLIGRARDSREVAVLLVDASMLDQVRELESLPRSVIVVAADAAAEEALGDNADLSISGLADPTVRLRVLRAAYELATARAEAASRRRELVCTRRDLHELNEISIGLMSERDQDALLHRIVDQGRFLTESDGACLFLVQEDEDKVSRLYPAVFEADSLSNINAIAERPPQPLALDHSSIVGHAAVMKQHLVIANAYEVAEGAGFTSNVEFEEKFGYYVKSMLVVPMLDRRDRVIGVLAYVNRKRDRGAKVTDKASAERNVLPYTRREVRLGRALAGFAATAIESSALYGRIELILESMVRAGVSAIDQRDPSTAGHSIRVATLSCVLAQAVERGGRGRYRDLRFTREQMRELYFAALLHDLGKVTVREDVLMKAKRLTPELWERVSGRFDLIRRTVEADHYRTCAGHGAQLDQGCAEKLVEVNRFWDMVRTANQPGPLENSQHDLAEIARHTFRGIDDRPTPYLTSDELHYLQIPHGTLNEGERAEIQSHVEQTYLFLRQIPWTDDLQNLAFYARGHHEKLDGSGYPKGLKGDEIPVQTRLMTIADIFDALTEGDRPYRDAVVPDRALDIIQAEAKAGQLDAELVRVLVESQVYREILH